MQLGHVADWLKGCGMPSLSPASGVLAAHAHFQLACMLAWADYLDRLLERTLRWHMIAISVDWTHTTLLSTVP